MAARSFQNLFWTSLGASDTLFEMIGSRSRRVFTVFGLCALLSLGFRAQAEVPPEFLPAAEASPKPSALPALNEVASLASTPSSTPSLGPSPDPFSSPSPTLPPSQVVVPLPPIPAVELSAAIKKGLTGFDAGEGTQEDWKDLKKQAETFISFRRGRMPIKAKLLWVAECLRHPEESVFCQFIVERRAQKKLDVDSAPEPAIPPPDLLKVSEYFVQKNLKALKGLPESRVHRALRLFPHWAPLAPLVDAALSEKECPSTALLTSLGQKAEEFFPDQSYREISKHLYKRSASCGGNEDESANKARFRYSLLQIWEGGCRQAEPYLLALSSQKDIDYITRSLFWRVHCAQTAGNKLLAAAVRGRLLNEFPMSYHGLLLGGKRGRDLARVMEFREPIITFHSSKVPALNPVIRGVEALQILRENDLALELLDSIEDRIGRAEVPFRLYIALLLRRSSDMISQFRLIAGIFREDPSLISRTTLELFYPLKRLEDLNRYSTQVDPYLVAALIRQESGFNERARSAVGAMGLMQLMPHTARLFERVTKRELLDPKTNIRLGVKYFKRLVDRFHGDAELALASYNAGPEKVDDWRRRYTTGNRMLFLDMIPFAETRNYVALIGRNYYWYLKLYPTQSKGVLRRPAEFTFLQAINQ